MMDAADVRLRKSVSFNNKKKKKKMDYFNFKYFFIDILKIFIFSMDLLLKKLTVSSCGLYLMDLTLVYNVI